MAPDYVLTIWNWSEEKISLHTKAFGQDIYRVKFSIDDDFRLTTGGIGHIRFWNIASTFTGLKLQGSIGKFGKVDLSNIIAFAELPDGKVVSGTENGSLLLWEGNFIKCLFTQPNGISCHNKEITYLEYDREDGCIISGSRDGYLRWWDFHTIDTAEVDSDQSLEFEIIPIAEFRSPDGSGIINAVFSNTINLFRSIVLHSENGSLDIVKFKLILKGNDMRDDIEMDSVRDVKLIDVLKYVTTIGSHKLLESNAEINSQDKVARGNDYVLPLVIKYSQFHTGRIVGLDACPNGPFTASCDSFGNIFLVDYIDRKIMAKKYFGVKSSCLVWIPLHINTNGNSFVVGFEDGTLRVLTITSINDTIDLALEMVIKPHNAAICCISFGNSSVKPKNFVATSCIDGNIFLFDTTRWLDVFTWEPIRFVSLKSTYCQIMQWNIDNNILLCSCNDKIIRNLDISNVLGDYISGIHQSEDISTFYSNDAQVNELVLNISNLSDGSNSSTDSMTLSQSSVLSHNAIFSVTSNGETSTSLLATCVTSNGNYSYEFTKTVQDNTYESSSDDYIIGNYKSNDLKTPLINVMKYSNSKRLLAQGAADGSVILRPTSSPLCFIRNSIHNLLIGGVSSIAVSFDDKYVISAGFDGVLVIQRVRLDLLFSEKASNILKDIESGVIRQQSMSSVDYLELVSCTTPMTDSFPNVDEFAYKANTTITIPSSQTIRSITDISIDACSIEDAKLKSGLDIKQIEANKVKRETMMQVDNLRQMLISLLKANDKLPDVVKLPREEFFKVDHELWDLLEEESIKRIEDIHMNYAYDFEKSLRLRDKVNIKLLTGIIIQEQTLHAFPTYFYTNIKKFSDEFLPSVSSLRVEGLPQDVLDLLETIHHKQSNASQSNSNNEKSANESLHHLLDTMTLESKTLKLESSITSTSNINVMKRQELRKQRIENLRNLELLKPSADSDDIRDIQMISDATKNAGDYKLKASQDYVIHDNHLLTASYKKEEMVLLEEYMLNQRMAFNESFYLLRDRKYELVEKMKLMYSRIRDIDVILQEPNKSEYLWYPEHDVNEYIDDFDDISDEDLVFVQKQLDEGKTWDEVVLPIHYQSKDALISRKRVDSIVKKDPITGRYNLSRPILPKIDIPNLRQYVFNSLKIDNDRLPGGLLFIDTTSYCLHG